MAGGSRSKRLSRAVIVGGAAAFCSALSVASAGAEETSTFLHPLGPIAAAQKSQLVDVVLLMMIVIVPVFVLVPWFAYRYRRTRKDGVYRPKWEFSTPLEFAIWGVPVLVVGALAWLIVAREVPIGPYKAIASEKPPLHVQVVGLDWKWLFIYPEQGIATVGTLALPTDRPVAFDLTSDSVMQSFFISGLGSQIYVMAGMVTRLNLLADVTGKTSGRNTQYNGNGFHQQRFSVEAMPGGDFAAWAGKVREGGIALTDESYRTLAEKGTLAAARARLAGPGMPADQIYFGSVPAEFFRGVVGKYMGGDMSAGPRPSTGNAVSATGSSAS